jgi:hypothetical protein
MARGSSRSGFAPPLPPRAGAARVLALAVALAGCGTASLVSQWRDDSYAGPAFESFLVVGFTPNDGNRRLFESEFVKQLAQRSEARGAASAEHIPAFADIDSTHIVEIVRQNGYDAVLVTRLVRVDQRTQYTPGGAQVAPETYYNDLYDYTYTVYREVESMGSVGAADVVVLETNVYSVEGARLVWTGMTESYSPENIEQVVDDLAILVLGSLRQYHMLK